MFCGCCPPMGGGGGGGGWGRGVGRGSHVSLLTPTDAPSSLTSKTSRDLPRAPLLPHCLMIKHQARKTPVSQPRAPNLLYEPRAHVREPHCLKGQSNENIDLAFFRESIPLCPIYVQLLGKCKNIVIRRGALFVMSSLMAVINWKSVDKCIYVMYNSGVPTG